MSRSMCTQPSPFKIGKPDLGGAVHGLKVVTSASITGEPGGILVLIVADTWSGPVSHLLVLLAGFVEMYTNGLSPGVS